MALPPAAGLRMRLSRRYTPAWNRVGLRALAENSTADNSPKRFQDAAICSGVNVFFGMLSSSILSSRLSPTGMKVRNSSKRRRTEHRHSVLRPVDLPRGQWFRTVCGWFLLQETHSIYTRLCLGLASFYTILQNSRCIFLYISIRYIRSASLFLASESPTRAECLGVGVET